MENTIRKSSCWTGVIFSYFEDIIVEAVSSIDEVQSASCDWDGEHVVKDLAVKFSLEHLWFPSFPQTSGHLNKDSLDNF